MALYHLRVRNYSLSKYSKDHLVHTPVQSPVQSSARQQGDCAVPCTVRLLDREKRLGVHLVNHEEVLTAWDGGPPYLAEAHGIIIRTLWQSCPRPIWVVQENVQFEPPFPVHIVDLVTNESMDSECASICWVPHYEESDGTLLTVLNDAPGEVQIGSMKTTKSNVVTQVPGCPGKTKAEWVETKRLENCRKLNKKEKEIKFNAQLESLRSTQATSISPPASLRDRIRSPLDRLLTSPFRLDTLPDHSAAPDEDLEVPRLAASDQSNEDSLVSSSDWSDDEYLSDDPFDQSRPLSMVGGPRQLCCRYPDLAPTMSNPTPKHRHLQHRECSRGSNHEEHCIFTDLQPTKCFLQNHQHCRLPSADEVEIIDPDSTTITPFTVSGPSSLAPVLEQHSSLSIDSTSQQQFNASDDDEVVVVDANSEDDYKSVCAWPLVPDIKTRLRSPDLSGLVDCTLDSSAFLLLERTPAPETQPTSPSADMMDVDVDARWTPADEVGMSLLQHGLPFTPPPSDGIHL